MSYDELLSLIREYIDAPDRRTREEPGYKDDRVGGRLGGRRGTFHDNFYEGFEGNPLSEDKLSAYRWGSLGWRFGVILGAATDESLTREEQHEYAGLIFDMLSHLYAGTLHER